MGLLAGIESSNEAPNDEDGLKAFKPANPVAWDVSGLDRLLELEETVVAPVAWLESELENKDEAEVEEALEGVTVCWG